ncbi:TPA: glycosyltransferase family 39 protein [Candidatus Scatousia excrementigallinarum]|uniref:Glycosyltransferase family 39 protein n=1 Tax=Candidatus Scatousia excrementigallinarum TaxID=2840935 RepID=A0A9D1EX12_9BACT|nr:glycosyltransferase family 39 protein [Candidatus Scatousia excrementigallinarum]
MNAITRTLDFVKKHPEWFTVLGLCILFYFIFFHNIGNYPLMDVDETRYVSMARDMFHTKDFMTLILDDDYFFEKPPLFFWGECISFAVFGKINEFTARFPVALYGTLTCFLTYFMGRKIVSRNYGVVSSLILATCFEFVILAKFAILDIVVSTCVAFSIMLGFLTFFCKEENKKFCIWLFYIFSGLAVMAKGIPGFVLPFGVMFFALLLADKVKSALKPKYLLVGLTFFLLIVLPWHLLMLKIHNPVFYEEYIIKHHLARFFTSNDIDRSEPVWFYFVNLIWGMVPWIFSALAIVAVKCKNFRLEIFKNFKFNFNELDDAKKYLILNWLAAIFILLFFSSSSTKLITYILPVYVHLACILGFAWLGYIESGKYKKAINISVYIWGGFCIFLAVAALFTPLFLPEWLYNDIYQAKWLCIGFVAFCGISSILCAIKHKPWGVFFTYVIFTMLVSAFCTKQFFLIDYKFGQNDLMEFAKYAHDTKDQLISFGDTRRYSLLYYYGAHIKYIEELTQDNLEEELEKNDALISVKKKNLAKYGNGLKYKTVLEGRKYILIRGK